MKNIRLQFLVAIAVLTHTVLAQPRTPLPDVPAMQELEMLAPKLEWFSSPAFSDDLIRLERELAGMGPRLAGIPIADLSLLHAELALAGRPGMMLTPPPMVWSSPEMLAELSLLENDPPQQDPGYQTYKDGYNLILQEKWDDARKKLGELATKFSKSRYVDDAHYWVAYSWMKDQPKKAAQLYREFFKKYPTSNYFDDAVADLGRLEGNAAADSARASRSAYEARSFSQSMISAAPVIMPVPAIAPSPGQTYTVAPSTLFPPNAEGNADDPELRIKKNAIEALRRNPDERAFITISE
ncbi:MAG TPA: outer membrane protein assembly factor BamD, partial [Bacteroidota bacterium]